MMMLSSSWRMLLAAVVVSSVCEALVPTSLATRQLQTPCWRSTDVSRRQPVPVMISHRKGFKKLGKPADQRKALLRALTTECIRHGRITTTFVRAKEARRHVDRMIELGKKGDLHSRRQAMAWIYDKQLVHAMFEQAPTRYGQRNGGYTRVLRTMPRRGDNAKMGILELV